MNDHVNLRCSAALVFILASGAGLAAQEAGSLAGTVLNLSGAPIAGVRVAISSPNMLNVRVVTTNARGEYRAPLLPVGTYSVVVSKQGWIGQKAENIRVGLGTAVTHNFSLKSLADMSETVDIIASATEIDKADTATKINFSAAQLESLAMINRRFQGAAELAPGLVSGVGGSFSIRGGATQNTQYRINGTDIKDDYQGTQTNLQIVPDNIEDVQVVLSELNARYGRSLGGAINIVTKSGSNTFSGSIRSDLDKVTWQSNSHIYLWYNSVYGGDDAKYSDNLSRQYQITLNGPIIKDHLWFAASTYLIPISPTINSIPRLLERFGLDSVVQAVNGPTGDTPVSDPYDPVNSVLNNGPAGYSWSNMDEGKTFMRKDELNFYQVKLTGIVLENHTLELGYTREERTISPRDPLGGYIFRIAALGTQKNTEQQYSFGYRGILSGNLFLEARYNKLENKIAWPLGDTSLMPGNELLATYNGIIGRAGISFETYGFGTGVPTSPSLRGNDSGNANLKWIADFGPTNHEFDFGVDYYSGILNEPNQSGDGNYVINVGGVYDDGHDNYLFPVVNFMGQGMFGQGLSGNWGPAPIWWQYYGRDGDLKSPSTSFYVNDKFSINRHWNGMLGVRFENSKVNDTDRTQLANTTFISPRFQIKYDLHGDNAHVFGLSLARFGSDFQIGFADKFATRAKSKGIKYGWTGNKYDPYDGNDPSGQYGVRFVDIHELLNRDNFQNPFFFEDQTITYEVDPKLTTEYMDEFTFSYRRQTRQGSVSLTYVNRSWKNAWAYVTEYTPEYVREVKDPSPGGTMLHNYTTTINVTNSNDLKRKYEGLEAEFTARLNSYWTMGGNWTISRLTGNHEGGDSASGTFRDNETTAYYLNWSLLQARGVSRNDIAPYGPLLNDQPQRGRLWALVGLPLGKGQVSFSWSLIYDLTKPESLTYYRPLLKSDEAIPRPDGLPGIVPGRPPVYRQYYNQKRDIFRNNDIYRVDFKISFAIPMGLPKYGERVQLIGDVSVTNLFNTTLISKLYMYTNEWYASSSGSSTFKPEDTHLWGTTAIAYDEVYQYDRGYRRVEFSLGLRF